MILLRKVTSADSSAITGTTVLRKLYWENPTNAGDTVVIQDGSANEQITLRCESANQSQVIDFNPEGLRIAGYKVSTLASGNLYIYG